jgi:DNA-binding transcriptional LysR family regulator
MHKVNIKSLDLNLLVALSALLEEKHVSRAALRANLSQPAMSRVLGRLRVMFADPLLVKGTRGMVLTARAITLNEPLQIILRDIENLVKPPAINPQEMQGEIVIACRDYELVTIMPQAINIISQQAPLLSIRIVQLIGDDLSLLEQHKVDFVLAGTNSSSATLHRHTLFNDSFVCALASNNPYAKQPLTLERYIQMKHCLVTISNVGMGIVDEILEKKNMQRNITVFVPYFLGALSVIEYSDLIITLPKRVGEWFANHGKIVLLEPPLTICSFAIHLYWHQRNHQNPIHQWVKEVIKKVSGVA